MQNSAAWAVAHERIKHQRFLIQEHRGRDTQFGDEQALGGQQYRACNREPPRVSVISTRSVPLWLVARPIMERGDASLARRCYPARGADAGPERRRAAAAFTAVMTD